MKVLVHFKSVASSQIRRIEFIINTGNCARSVRSVIRNACNIEYVFRRFDNTFGQSYSIFPVISLFIRLLIVIPMIILRECFDEMPLYGSERQEESFHPGR